MRIKQRISPVTEIKMPDAMSSFLIFVFLDLSLYAVPV
jgi:hypothetical protein